ncbi:YARHG domain-containing protein [Clostridium bowmanii]|uniref:YARHG domain-containing protein n=1 Tax=Clostridium bowmanii TaxID=132925 RepID=UPI001C0D4A11|nr:YARHG domain-containing protein [Clostridium bowmanii]MBU3188178.1 YARHG domain-containing protein [Clostridium bowmanii]MCA1072360.1 YARHG domain-containing protein [Clostridium bowmanii]
MYCSKCGYELEDGTNFCRKCGSKNIYNNLIPKERKSTLNANITSKENNINQNNLKVSNLNETNSNEINSKQTTSKEIGTKQTKHKGFIILGILIVVLSVGFGSYYVSISKLLSDNSKNSEKTSTKNKVIPNNKTTNSSEVKKEVVPPKNSNDISNINSPTYFIFPKSESEKLLDSDLSLLKKENLTLARNEIYARHGFIFKTEAYRTYFNKKSWYSENPNFKGSDEELTDVETYNIKIISKYENK